MYPTAEDGVTEVPLYEYECRSCAHRFEKLRKFSDAPLTHCPKCGKETVEQLISAPAIQFKGSGWYVTDYTKSSTSTAASTPANSGMEAAGSSAKSSENKSAAGSKPAASENKAAAKTATAKAAD